MSEAVLDEAIEQIADGLSVDWSALDAPAPGRAREWAKSLRVLSDIVKLHRDAAADYDQTTLATMPATETAAVAEPDTWGKYRLANKVGEGSYGSVYRAWDSELERDVAIKILHRRVGDTRLRERLLQEGRALAKVQHNNVVRVLGIEAHGDRVGLCMEFVRGKTLADIVRDQGRLSAAEAVLIGQDLCRALSAVHRAGFIHRDVKAKNVMRDDAGRIVLMDFGTGRAAEAQAAKSDRAGTPLYMAPEALEEGQASPRSDVYSLGVLLYYLVSGDYPVNARTIDELRAAHANREHRWLSELRPDLPVAFMQVVERAIALDPDERYETAGDLLAALSNIGLGSRSILWKFGLPVLCVLAIFLVIAGMGALTSASFDRILSRVGFGLNQRWEPLVWGIRASVSPAFMLMLMFLALAPVVVIRRVLIAASSMMRSLDASLRLRLASAAHRARLDEVPVLASCALCVSSFVMASAWWYFAPLLSAIASGVSTAPPEQLALLSPANVGLHNQYRQVFAIVVILSLLVWYPVIRLVRRGQSFPLGFGLAGAIVTGVALLFLQFPYRLLYFSLIEPFEAVTWRDAQCYEIGAREDDLLLFCPGSQPPRNRVVMKNDSELKRSGIRENIFSSFGKRP